MGDLNPVLKRKLTRLGKSRMCGSKMSLQGRLRRPTTLTARWKAWIQAKHVQTVPSINKTSNHNSTRHPSSPLHRTQSTTSHRQRLSRAMRLLPPLIPRNSLHTSPHNRHRLHLKMSHCHHFRQGGRPRSSHHLFPHDHWRLESSELDPRVPHHQVPSRRTPS